MTHVINRKLRSAIFDGLKKCSEVSSDFHAAFAATLSQSLKAVNVVSKPLSFDLDTITQSTPDSKGIYTLYNEEEIPIYCGKAERLPLNVKIAMHLDSSNDLMNDAKYFSFEISSRPAKRQEQFLKVYKDNYGSIPQCNGQLESNAQQSLLDITNERNLTFSF